MLVRLLYASRAVGPLNAAMVEAILQNSRRCNLDVGITGVLCHGENIFVQVLEGGRDAVSECYNRIVRDARHTNVRLLSYQEIAERRFGGWQMGQVDLAKVNPALLLKYAETASLNPFVLSGTATMALLEELLASAAVVARCS